MSDQAFIDGWDLILGKVAPAVFNALATVFRRHEAVRYRALRPVAGVPEIGDAVRELEAEATPVEVPGALAPQRAYEAFALTHPEITTVPWHGLPPEAREAWAKIAIAAVGPSTWGYVSP